MQIREALFLVAFVSGGIPLASPQEAAPEKAAVEKVLSEFLSARNARDAEAAAQFFADDYDQGNLAMGRLQIKSGRERYEAYKQAFQEGRMRNRMDSETKNFRLLTSDVAIADVELKFINDEGRQEFVNFATFVYVQRDGKWLIGAVRLSPLAETAPGSN